MTILQGVLRLTIEVAALAGIGYCGFQWMPSHPVVGILTRQVIAGGMWGVFNVPNDPSRGGGAPVPVSGRTRLAVEGCILAWGGYGWALWNPVVCGMYVVAIVTHYGNYHKRIRWLLQQQ